MNKKCTISPELKVEVVEKYLYHVYAFRECLRIADVSDGTFEMWVSKYRAFGPSGLLKTIHSIKKATVEAYVSGLGSQNDICSKYGISTRTRLQRWTKKYNGDNTIISSRLGEFITESYVETDGILGYRQMTIKINREFAFDDKKSEVND